MYLIISIFTNLKSSGRFLPCLVKGLWLAQALSCWVWKIQLGQFGPCLMMGFFFFFCRCFLAWDKHFIKQAEPPLGFQFSLCFPPPVLLEADFYGKQEMAERVFSALSIDLRWKVIKSL